MFHISLNYVHIHRKVKIRLFHTRIFDMNVFMVKQLNILFYYLNQIKMLSVGLRQTFHKTVFILIKKDKLNKYRLFF